MVCGRIHSREKAERRVPGLSQEPRLSMTDLACCKRPCIHQTDNDLDHDLDNLDPRYAVGRRFARSVRYRSARELSLIHI